jgi:hypothetical protein
MDKQKITGTEKEFNKEVRKARAAVEDPFCRI